MAIYFIQFFVVPTESNLNFNKIKDARVLFWIRCQDEVSATVKAKFEISKYDFTISKVIDRPREVTRGDFIGKDLELESYQKAKTDGMASVYFGIAKDEQEVGNSYEIKSSQNFDLNFFLKKQKQLSNNGRCLHFDDDQRCNSIIKAHSIQRNGVLSEIDRDGKVYQVSKNFGDLKKSNGLVNFQLDGIGRVSTFKGFCKYHDNKLFGPIDNSPLIPTNEQIFLYSYRSLCKELFVKENALKLIEEQYEMIKESQNFSELLSGMLRGTKNGYKNLIRHKKMFDISLKNKKYEEIKYVVFVSEQSPFMAFSGVIYPEFDFMGNQIQDLSDEKESFDLLTFCSAPVNDGWAFTLSWHINSSKACIHLMRSLATILHKEHGIGDLLFRFVIANCENVAFSPYWWEGLSNEDREKLSEKMTDMADVLALVQPNYLKDGLSGISNWQFQNVYSEM